MARKRRILCVCLGNICRSPAAEGVLRHAIAERGLDNRIEVDSAGTIDHHAGEPPDGRMTEAARDRGYTLAGASRPIRESDLAKYDLILAMDRSNLADIRALDREGRFGAKIRLLGSFIDPHMGDDVPDPYYGGRVGFDTVIDMLEAAAPRIIDEVSADDPR